MYLDIQNGKLVFVEDGSSVEFKEIGKDVFKLNDILIVETDTAFKIVISKNNFLASAVVEKLRLVKLILKTETKEKFLTELAKVQFKLDTDQKIETSDELLRDDILKILKSDIVVHVSLKDIEKYDIPNDLLDYSTGRFGIITNKNPSIITMDSAFRGDFSRIFHTSTFDTFDTNSLFNSGVSF